MLLEQWYYNSGGGGRAEAGDGDITWWMLDADEHFPAKTAILYKIYLAGNFRHDFPAKKCLLSTCDQRTSAKLHLTFVTIYNRLR